MEISLVVAASENNVIGNQGKIPWHLPDDLKFFRALTTGSPIIMGRKTYESIGKPLPDRTNIVVTHNTSYKADGCIVVSSMEEAIKKASESNPQEIFVIGGGQMYKEALPQTDCIYLTRAHTTIEGDAYFPEIDPAKWNEIERREHPIDDKHAYAFTFLTYERIR